MAAKLDPAMLKLIQKEINDQIAKSKTGAGDAEKAVEGQIKELKSMIADSEAIMAEFKKTGVVSFLKDGAKSTPTPEEMKAAKKKYAAKHDEAYISADAHSKMQRQLEEKQKELEQIREKFKKESIEAANRLKAFVKESTKSDLGVSDMKVLKNKVATLEKIVKALMAASKTGAKDGGSGGGVAEAELTALQEKVKAQDKKMAELEAVKDEMTRQMTRVETQYGEKGGVLSSKVVKDAPKDPVKWDLVEANLKRLEDEKKLLEDSIKVVQSKQESRKKEIEDAVAAAEAKMDAERKERDKLRAEQMKKLKKEQEATIKKMMDDVQKNVLESRIAALEEKLAQALSKG